MSPSNRARDERLCWVFDRPQRRHEHGPDCAEYIIFHKFIFFVTGRSLLSHKPGSKAQFVSAHTCAMCEGKRTYRKSCGVHWISSDRYAVQTSKKIPRRPK